MKKLKINERYEKIFDEWNYVAQGVGKIGTNMIDYEIDIIQHTLCETSKFRKIVHTIVDICDEFKNKENIHNEISNKNYTNLIMYGVIDVIDEVK